MYYFFTSKIVHWKSDILQATLLSRLTRQQMQSWIFAKELNPSISEFVFSIVENSVLPDNYWTGAMLDLYSEKLISVLDKEKIRFELFPVKMIEDKTKKELNLKYYVFRLLDIYDCLDESASEFEMVKISGRDMKRILVPVFKTDFLNLKKMMFRIAGHENCVMVHSDVKRLIEDSEISGCEFSVDRHFNENLIGGTAKGI